MDPIMPILIENLKELKLTAMIRELPSHLRQARETGMDPAELLLTLADVELQARAEKRFQRRLKDAKFPVLKVLETFDTRETPGLDMRLYREIAQAAFIKEPRNVIFLGNSGTGKTHMATGIGVNACKNNHTVRFVACYDLANELLEARQARDLRRILKRYARYDLLILDELGYLPFSREGSELLFQLLADRHEKKATMITTNLGFGEWTKIFADPAMAAALLDRLTHRAYIINCLWDSFRLKQSLNMTK